MFINVRESRREREKHQCEKHLLTVSCIYVPQLGNQTISLGMRLDWESNLQTFGVWDDASTN